MEKYFVVKESNPIYKEYFDWWNNLDVVTESFKKFKKLTGIESEEFCISTDLIIKPTENDLVKFEKEFLKNEISDGLKQFKKNSSIQKAWTNFINGGHIKLIKKPSTIFDFTKVFFLRGSSNLFHWKDKLYTKISSENFYEDFEVPEGYEQIKASEYYKIEEEIKEKQNDKM